MRWDIFCKVIDNFGDMGVCWRLCADLADRGHAVRLWVDDDSALSWMCPPSQRHSAIEVLPWDAPAQEPGDVVIEAFGCNPPDAFIEMMQRPAAPIWINLEYLSAEAWVERCHGLPSPVMSGPGKGLRKWFYYPGFTPATGGLLREARIASTHPDHDSHLTWRNSWLASQGMEPLQDGEKLISLFCYEQAPVHELLTTLATLPLRTRILVTPGFAHQHCTQWQSTHQASGLMRFHPLVHMPHQRFDEMLLACDLNFVRGEDSAVRALWTGKPHVWNIYPQDDGVHADKLHAFMRQWMKDWPEELSQSVTRLWRAWNRLSDEGFSDLPTLLQDSNWPRFSQVSSRRLMEIPDLVTQLCSFASSRS